MDASGLPVVNFVDSPLHKSNLGHLTVEVSDRQGSVWPKDAQLSPSERASALSDGRQEYIGICLPFDLRMMFQVSCEADITGGLCVCDYSSSYITLFR
jgi:hypothetical protein